MSYSQLGYSYPSAASASAATAPLTSSQLLVPGCTSLSSSLPPPAAAPPPPQPQPPTTTTTAAAAAAAMSDPTAATQSVYSSSLLSYPRLTDTSSLYGSAYAAQGYVPFGGDPSAFYSPLAGDTTEAWRNLSQTTAWPYDPNGMAGYPYSTGYGGLDVRRKNATRESTATLKAWLYEHIKNPYPTKGEKIMLAIITKMTLTQVSTWFANARRRLKKENKMQWSPRNRTGDDDDKINSDDEDDKDDHDVHKDDVKKEDKKDDDEDIVVDGGNDTDSLLSGSDKPEDMQDKASNNFDLDHSDPMMLRRPDVNVTSSNGSTSSPPLSDNLFSPLSGSKLPPPSSLTNGVHSGGLGSNMNTMGGGHSDTNTSEKPRIWSIADVATSGTTPVVRRSPLQGMSGGGQLPGKLSQTAFSPPAASPHGFQPWVNGSFSTPSPVTSHSAAGLSYSPYHLGPHHMPAMGQLGGHMGGIAPSHRDLGPSNPCVNSLSSPPSYAPKLSNGFLGDKHDINSLSGYSTPDDSHTAFKPVVKRL